MKNTRVVLVELTVFYATGAEHHGIGEHDAGGWSNWDRR